MSERSPVEPPPPTLLINPAHKTTQSALLEKPLTWFRTRKVAPYVQGRSVLDFGCGRHFRTLRMLLPQVKEAAGFDLAFLHQPQQQTHEGITVYGDLNQIQRSYDVILALACFEHIAAEELVSTLRTLKRLAHPATLIVGTAPTPSAKPVLEFLSYRLGLIDETQIRDHKVYYDEATLRPTVEAAGWQLAQYEKFQVGFNGFFVLKPALEKIE